MGFARALIHFFYPSYCLYCKGIAEKNHHLLCDTCFELIEWIDPKERCKNCWGKLPCKGCEKVPRYLPHHLSLFDGFGPISSLYQHFLKTHQGKGLLALMLLKLSRSSFPLPDVVTPNSEKYLPLNDPAHLLAKHLAKLIGKPCAPRGEKLSGQTVLVITPTLTKLDDLIEKQREIRGYLPKKIYSMALIDRRA